MGSLLIGRDGTAPAFLDTTNGRLPHRHERTSRPGAGRRRAPPRGRAPRQRRRSAPSPFRTAKPAATQELSPARASPNMAHP